VWCDSNADGLCFVGSSGTYANIPAFAVLRVAQ